MEFKTRRLDNVKREFLEEAKQRLHPLSKKIPEIEPLLIETYMSISRLGLRTFSYENIFIIHILFKLMAMDRWLRYFIDNTAMVKNSSIMYLTYRHRNDLITWCKDIYHMYF